MLPGGILYVRISQFMQNTAVEFGQVIVDHDLKQIKGIVLDLRRNRGGIPSEYMEILTLFVKKPITLYQTSPRVNEVTIGYRPSLKGLPLIEGTEFAAWRPQRTDEDVDGRLSDIPLITLTSPYCFSACDTMVSAMKHNGIGKILGEPTAGGTGQPIVFDLPGSEHMFRYSVVRGKTILNDWLEGVGTQPDVYIPQTAKDIIDGKDYQLEQALEHFPAGLIPNIFAPVSRPLVKAKTDTLKFTPEVWEQYLMSVEK